MQITLEIPDEKYTSFMEVVKNLNFVKIRKEKKLNLHQQEFVDDLKNSLQEVELHLKGKIKLQSAREFLKELENETV